MTTSKNILYIGPYTEYTDRGNAATNNILALKALGHNVHCIPIYTIDNHNHRTEKDLDEIIQKCTIQKLDNYDICIQHCDALNYVYDSRFKMNIGIYSFDSIKSDPIIETRFNLLDRIVVNTIDKLHNLSGFISDECIKKIKYCPEYIDVNKMSEYSENKFDWVEPNQYYFYSEIEFTDLYDWEKLLYVYITSLMNSQSKLIIRTKNLDDDQMEILTDVVRRIAVAANISPANKSLPKVLNGTFTTEQEIKLINSINCIVDVSKGNNFNYSFLKAAAFNKKIIANTNTSSAHILPNISLVESYPCNININYHNDQTNSTMYNYYYSIDTNSLRENMLNAFYNRFDHQNLYDDVLINNYDIKHANNLIC